MAFFDKKHLQNYILAFCVMVLAGLVCFLGISNYYAYQETFATITGLQTEIQTGSLLSYGIVGSVDTENDIITVQVPDPFSSTGAPRELSMHVSQNAYIASESLVEESGVYVGLSGPTPAQLSNVQVGDRVALLFHGSTDELTVSEILFGDPI